MTYSIFELRQLHDKSEVFILSRTEQMEKENKVKSERKYKVTKRNKEFIVLGVG